MANASHRKAVIGCPTGNFWLYDSATGYDLTHPITPTTSPSGPRVTIKTTRTDITISPSKTALCIIDMQNFFLSPQLGRPKDSKGLLAQKQLLEHAIPAARKAGIRIIWLNWGLTQEDIEHMPPATLRAFGFQSFGVEASDEYSTPGKILTVTGNFEGTESQRNVDQRDSFVNSAKSAKKDPRLRRGLGSDIGPVTLENGNTVQGGRSLMRDAWNTALTPELNAAYQEGTKADPPDVWMHKNRLSGLWGAKTDCVDFLEKEGIRTLLFAGVNTDQCVAGSLQDAFTKGYDCILLTDGAATTSPHSCQEATEFNCMGTYGFCTTCKDFADGVEKINR